MAGQNRMAVSARLANRFQTIVQLLPETEAIFPAWRTLVLQYQLGINHRPPLRVMARSRGLGGGHRRALGSRTSSGAACRPLRQRAPDRSPPAVQVVGVRRGSDAEPVGSRGERGDAFHQHGLGRVVWVNHYRRHYRSRGFTTMLDGPYTARRERFDQRFAG
jgi:hypothetical protein